MLARDAYDGLVRNYEKISYFSIYQNKLGEWRLDGNGYNGETYNIAYYSAAATLENVKKDLEDARKHVKKLRDSNNWSLIYAEER